MAWSDRGGGPATFCSCQLAPSHSQVASSKVEFGFQPENNVTFPVTDKQQPVEHGAKLTWHCTAQMPALHVACPFATVGHGAQLPQWSGSVWVSTQAPPHMVSPAQVLPPVPPMPPTPPVDVEPPVPYPPLPPEAPGVPPLPSPGPTPFVVASAAGSAATASARASLPASKDPDEEPAPPQPTKRRPASAIATALPKSDLCVVFTARQLAQSSALLQS